MTKISICKLTGFKLHSVWFTYVRNFQQAAWLKYLLHFRVKYSRTETPTRKRSFWDMPIPQCPCVSDPDRSRPPWLQYPTLWNVTRAEKDCAREQKGSKSRNMLPQSSREEGKASRQL